MMAHDASSRGAELAVTCHVSGDPANHRTLDTLLGFCPAC